MEAAYSQNAIYMYLVHRLAAVCKRSLREYTELNTSNENK